MKVEAGMDSSTRRGFLKTTGVLGMGSFASNTATAATVSASFSYSPSTPHPDDDVTFDGSESGGDVSSYTWEFEDQYSEEYGETVTHSFDSGGTYSVTLTVEDTDGNTDSATRDVRVVNYAPEPDFTVSPSVPAPDEDVTFDAGSSDDSDGRITSYTWEFEDQYSEEYGETVTHSFDSGGKYDVTLTVTDNGGKTASRTKTVTVDNDAPRPWFTVSPTPPYPEAELTFDASGSADPDGRITSYTWEFEDQYSEKYGETVTHTFSESGTYDVTLTVTDNGGITKSLTKTFDVSNSAPRAKIAVSKENPDPGEGLTIGGSSADHENNIEEYDWSIDGQSYSGEYIQVQFPEVGVYDVHLTVTDSLGLSDSATKTVVVGDLAPTPEITVETEDPIATNPVTFDATESSDRDGEITAYTWTFPDGTEKTGATVEHTFETAETYEVSLAVVDDANNTATTTTTITVGAPPTTRRTTTREPTTTTSETTAGTESSSTTTATTTTTTEPPADAGGQVSGGGGIDFPATEVAGGLVGLGVLAGVAKGAGTIVGKARTSGALVSGLGSAALRRVSENGSSGGDDGADAAPFVVTDDAAPESVPEPTPVDVAYQDVQLGEKIGSGGMADVYEATTPDFDGVFAVKEPRVTGTVLLDTIEKFEREAKVWNDLDEHPNIVTVLDWGTDPTPWLAMEYMDEGNLLAELDAMSLSQRVWTMQKIVEAVHHMHSRGVIHQDLKPENVLLTSVRDGVWPVPKIGDLGLAKLLRKHSTTMEGFSPHYAAPEQFDPDTYGKTSERTDVYQAGALAYLLLTGSPPHEGRAAEVMRSVLNADPTPPSDLEPRLPDAVDPVFEKVLSRNPSDRFETVVQFRDALNDALHS